MCSREALDITFVKSRLCLFTPDVQNLVNVIPLALEQDAKGPWSILDEWNMQGRYSCSALTKYSKRVRVPKAKDQLFLITDDRIDRYLNSARIEMIKESRYSLDLRFWYNKHCFQWWGVPDLYSKQQEVDIYLMENPDDPDSFAPRKSPLKKNSLADLDNYYCAEIPPGTLVTDFYKILDKLIEEYLQKGSKV